MMDTEEAKNKITTRTCHICGVDLQGKIEACSTLGCPFTNSPIIPIPGQVPTSIKHLTRRIWDNFVYARAAILDAALIPRANIPSWVVADNIILKQHLKNFIKSPHTTYEHVEEQRQKLHVDTYYLDNKLFLTIYDPVITSSFYPNGEVKLTVEYHYKEEPLDEST